MSKLANRLLDIVALSFNFLTLITTYILFKENAYGYIVSGKNTYALVNHNLLKIKNIASNGYNIGDTIYYYDTNDSGEYIITHSTLSFKSQVGGEYIYIFDSNPGEVIKSERIVGKITNQSVILGYIISVLTSKVGFMVCLILPLFLITIYKIYNMIIIPKRYKAPLKLNNLSVNGDNIRLKDPVRERLNIRTN